MYSRRVEIEFKGIDYIDFCLQFFRDIELYHPTFLYAYAALICQCGVIQIIGCLGAQRLSHKLLSVYWALLLLLTVGDVAVGLFWVFKLDKIKLHLKSELTAEFVGKYSRDVTFTKNWNRIQSQDHCCGVDGPLDFGKFLVTRSGEDTSRPQLSLPDSCCTYKVDQSHSPVSLPSQMEPRLERRRKNTRETFLKNIQTPYNRVRDESLNSFQRQQQFHQHQVRHFVNRQKVLGPGSSTTGSSLENGTLTDKVSVGGVPKLNDETLELAGNSVPFLCKNPIKHLSSKALKNYQKLKPHLSLGDEGENTEADEETNDGSEDRSPRHVENLLNGGSVSKAPSSLHDISGKNKVRVYRNGCGLKLVQWLNNVSEILFILGFCMVGFIKLCFLIILRWEIREMIEKIQILENGGIDLSNSLSSPRLSLTGRPGPRYSIQKQYSTTSGPILYSGITIKSPHGESHYYNALANHQLPTHLLYQHMDQGRRHSARSLGDPFETRRCSHSQETMNMTLLITNDQNPPTTLPEEPRKRPAPEEISLKVPTPEEQEAKRANFANHCTWDSNVSGDSSISGPYSASLFNEHCSCSTEGGTGSNNHVSGGRTQLVTVDMEKGRVSNGSSIEDPSVSVTGLAEGGENHTTTTVVPVESSNEPNPDIPNPIPCRLNGNNNINIQIDVDSDFLMALIGTPV